MKNVIQKTEKQEMIFMGKNMIHIRNFLDFISPTDEIILILGENGTGKELIAEYIHEQSTRKNEKFIAINCAAIPPTLIDSILFGYKKGSFSDAHKDTKGFFQEADGGTIFLDEIGDMAYETQARLLRTIETGEVQPVGATKPEKVNTRIICATNKDIMKLIENNHFKQDLYYRINTYKIILPPLRKRSKADVLGIANKQLALLNEDEYWKEKLSCPITLTDDAIQLIFKYSWPGNIRQLRNKIKEAFTFVVYRKKNEIDGNIIKEILENEQDSEMLFSKQPEKNDYDYKEIILNTQNFNLEEYLKNIERDIIVEALNKNKSQKLAGQMLGYSQQRIQYKIKKYKIKGNFN